MQMLLYLLLYLLPCGEKGEEMSPGEGSWGGSPRDDLDSSLSEDEASWSSDLSERGDADEAARTNGEGSEGFGTATSAAPDSLPQAFSDVQETTQVGAEDDILLDTEAPRSESVYFPWWPLILLPPKVSPLAYAVVFEVLGVFFRSALKAAEDEAAATAARGGDAAAVASAGTAAFRLLWPPHPRELHRGLLWRLETIHVLNLLERRRGGEEFSAEERLYVAPSFADQLARGFVLAPKDAVLQRHWQALASLFLLRGLLPQAPLPSEQEALCPRVGGGIVSVSHQLLQIPPAALIARERCFSVELLGEGAQDLGGPYAEVISAVCDDLRSSRLFSPSSNARAWVGEGRDFLSPSPLLRELLVPAAAAQVSARQRRLRSSSSLFLADDDAALGVASAPLPSASRQTPLPCCLTDAPPLLIASPGFCTRPPPRVAATTAAEPTRLHASEAQTSADGIPPLRALQRQWELQRQAFAQLFTSWKGTAEEHAPARLLLHFWSRQGISTYGQKVCRALQALGLLMGCSIISMSPLNLSLTPATWALLMGEQPAQELLLQQDLLAARHLRKLRLPVAAAAAEASKQSSEADTSRGAPLKRLQQLRLRQQAHNKSLERPQEGKQESQHEAEQQLPQEHSTKPPLFRFAATSAADERVAAQHAASAASGSSVSTPGVQEGYGKSGEAQQLRHPQHQQTLEDSQGQQQEKPNGALFQASSSVRIGSAERVEWLPSSVDVTMATNAETRQALVAGQSPLVCVPTGVPPIFGGAAGNSSVITPISSTASATEARVFPASDLLGGVEGGRKLRVLPTSPNQTALPHSPQTAMPSPPESTPARSPPMAKLTSEVSEASPQDSAAAAGDLEALPEGIIGIRRSPEEDFLRLLQHQTEWPRQPLPEMLAAAIAAAASVLPRDTLDAILACEQQQDEDQHEMQQQLPLQYDSPPRLFFKVVFLSRRAAATEALLLLGGLAAPSAAEKSQGEVAYAVAVEEALSGAAMVLSPLPFLVSLPFADAETPVAETGLHAPAASHSSLCAVCGGSRPDTMLQQQQGQTDTAVVSVVFALSLPPQFFSRHADQAATDSSCHGKGSFLQYSQHQQLARPVDDEVHTACAAVRTQLFRAVSSKYPEFNLAEADVQVRCIAVVGSGGVRRKSNDGCSNSTSSCYCMQDVLPFARGLLQCLSLDPWEALRRGPLMESLVRQRPMQLQRQQLLLSTWIRTWNQALNAATRAAAARARESFKGLLVAELQQEGDVLLAEAPEQLFDGPAALQVAQVAADAALCMEAFQAAAAAAAGFINRCSSRLWQLPPAEWLLALEMRLLHGTQQLQQHALSLADAEFAGCFPSVDCDIVYELARPLLQRHHENIQQQRQILPFLRRVYSKAAALSQLVDLATVADACRSAEQHPTQMQDKYHSLQTVYAAALDTARRNAATVIAAVGSEPMVFPFSVWHRFAGPAFLPWSQLSMPPSLAALEETLRKYNDSVQRQKKNRPEREDEENDEEASVVDCKEQQQHCVKRQCPQPSDEEPRQLRRRLCCRNLTLLDECMRFAAEEAQSTKALLDRLRL
ncbi:sac3 ganp family protein [Cyclospora cayetanensis]|uniref:Sac3 ganp family protein n=1 Tax=Cyclospora cayetanensis TaxID=88456 RepID=A0A1D3D3Q8_9EIME|nr:sac3 ganp family protein [Cyclospora cayetanensis]